MALALNNQCWYAIKQRNQTKPSPQMILRWESKFSEQEFKMWRDGFKGEDGFKLGECWTSNQMMFYDP